MDLNRSQQTGYVFQSANPILGFSADEKEAVWIPYEPGTANRFLMFDLNRNTSAVVLRCGPAPASIATTILVPWRANVCRVLGSTRSPTGSLGPGRLCISVLWVRTSHWMRTAAKSGTSTLFACSNAAAAFRLLDCCRRYYQENGLDGSYLDKITR
jgi:hypothetical protein